MLMGPGLAIGALSAASGVKVPTIRYYESVGLMPAPLRTGGNRRVYDRTAVGRLCFIRHARELGFEVDAIRQLLDLSEHPQKPCAAVDTLARKQLKAIDSRLARLEMLKRELEAMIKSCARGKVADCRIIDALSRPEHGQ